MRKSMLWTSSIALVVALALLVLATNPALGQTNQLPNVVTPVATVSAASTLTTPTVTVVSTTGIYFAPNMGSIIPGQLIAGQTWMLVGTDATRAWVKVQITPCVAVWAPASAFALGGNSLLVLTDVSITNNTSSCDVTATPVLN